MYYGQDKEIDERAELSELTKKWIDRVERGIPRGHDVVCGDSEKDEEFSWRPCELCGCKLAGSRHHAIAIQLRWEVFEPIDMMVCQDCLLFLANGDIPEDEYLTWLEV
jgi:hypothetical protein